MNRFIKTKAAYLKKAVCVLLASILAPISAFAQYYSWGADPASFRWQEIKTESISVIYPEHTDALSRRVLYYFDAVGQTISEGFKYGPLNLPVIIHPENFASNGLVMWLPKRIEYLSTPAADSYSMLWTKQLAAHEYRHAVQYNNLNRGWLRPLNYIFGQHAALAGLAFMPLFGLEGDAVLAETSMSSFGRGLQPSFSMEYRAMGREETLKRKNSDYLLGGSYLRNVPNHYNFGYQLSNYGMRRYGENIWDKITHFAVRHPYYFATTNVGMKKFYQTNVDGYIRATFNDLFDYWESLPKRENTLEKIVSQDEQNYTTYSHPIVLADSTILALKKSFSKPQSLVKLSFSESEEQKFAKEENVAFTGNPSTRPSYSNGRLWWSEYRQSKLFEQEVFSQLCYLDLSEGKPRGIKTLKNVLYPSAINNSKEEIAYVEYAPSGIYSIVRASIDIKESSHTEKSRFSMPSQCEIHGLAWDNKSEQLYFLATDNAGMWIGALDKLSDQKAKDEENKGEKGYKALTEAAFITLSNLSAANGKLYFGSIASGYDELHSLDVETLEEKQLSRSEFGAFYPAVAANVSDQYVYASVYDKFGYTLARQKQDAFQKNVPQGKLPQNIVNPKGGLYKMINLDTVNYTQNDAAESRARHESKKYRKGLNLFNVHSWSPIVFNPFSISAEQSFNLSYGAVLMSQNNLSNTQAYASYAYSKADGSILSAEIRNNMFGVELSAAASYGGEQLDYLYSGDIYIVDEIESGVINTEKYAQNPADYYTFGFSAALPLLFDKGYKVFGLSPYVSWSYNNGLVPNMDEAKDETVLVSDDGVGQFETVKVVPVEEGLDKINFALSHSMSTRAAKRDFASPWGYIVSAGYSLSAQHRDFADLVNFYAKLFTPGLSVNNSFTLAISYQTSLGYEQKNGLQTMLFKSASLIPRGFTTNDIVNLNYASASLNYQLPIFHPEGGIRSLIYFKRIRFNAGFDFARFDLPVSGSKNIYSWGGDLIFDVNAFRLPEAGTTALKLSVYKPSEGEIFTQFGLELPF